MMAYIQYEHGRLKCHSVSAVGIVLMICASIGGCASDAGSRDDIASVSTQYNMRPDRRVSLDSVVVYRNTVSLSNEIDIGDVSVLQIGVNGELLITDHIAKQVYLFRSDGQYGNTLSVEDCFPGSNWRPIRAQYNSKKEIVVTSSGGPWGFVFSGDGKCIESMEPEFLSPRVFDFGLDGEIYGLYYEVQPFVKIMTNRGAEIDRFGFLNYDVVVNRHFAGGGLLVDVRGNVYLSIPSSPYVYVYNAEGELRHKMGWKPGIYKENVERVEPGLVGDMLAGKMIDVYQNMSLNKDIYLLDHDLVMVQHLNMYQSDQARKISAVIMDLNGRDVLGGYLEYGDVFIAARHRLMYRMRTPEIDTSGNLKNPSIDVFEYRAARS